MLLSGKSRTESQKSTKLNFFFLLRVNKIMLMGMQIYSRKFLFILSSYSEFNKLPKCGKVCWLWMNWHFQRSKPGGVVLVFCCPLNGLFHQTFCFVIFSNFLLFIPDYPRIFSSDFPTQFFFIISKNTTNKKYFRYSNKFLKFASPVSRPERNGKHQIQTSIIVFSSLNTMRLILTKLHLKFSTRISLKENRKKEENNWWTKRKEPL